MTIIGAILSTLAEVDTGVPESTLYLACGVDIYVWQNARDLMIKMGWIEVKGHFVTLTELGRQTDTDYNNLLEQRKKDATAKTVC